MNPRGMNASGPNFRIRLLVVGLGAVSCLAQWALAKDSDRHSQICTNATLKGTYVFSQQGSVLGIAPAPVPAADVGLVSADGFGGLGGSETLNLGGQVVTDTFEDGVYEVNPDCTGTASWNAVFANGQSQPRTASFVISRKFKEIHILSTGPGTVLSGVGRQQ
jgi:hypothetical protein